ncbi:hypothetical protein EX30DRAFT_57261 [Ascodesmis nigricans]|uniref:Uncharacterized protein n=1 Tax=Ascodesmis nigricans TaxID=341454 RepID=A0A4V6RHE2_9PEZI|nr:hypothetical protein EX30DRAFT_57261 [Ascodesmis nigricans]
MGLQFPRRRWCRLRRSMTIITPVPLSSWFGMSDYRVWHVALSPRCRNSLPVPYSAASWHHIIRSTRKLKQKGDAPYKELWRVLAQCGL